MNLEFSQQIFEVYPNTKFHENPPSGSGVVPCGQMDRRTDFTRPIVDFRHFTNVPKTYDNIIWGLSHIRGKCKMILDLATVWCLVTLLATAVYT